jgi:serine/threonine protein phosphatase PrpC
LGTDGVWDGISIDEAVRCLDVNVAPNELAKRILDAGLKGLDKNQIEDNITNVVVYLKAL